MRRIIAGILLLVALNLPVCAQRVVVTAPALKGVPSTPSSCQPNRIVAVDGALYLGKLNGTCQIISSSTPPQDFISGLLLSWNSATSITVGTGSAYIPSTGLVLEVTSPITKSSLSLSASTWYYLYLYDNSGVADIDVSTTVPLRYHGGASYKTGNNARRFVGAVLTDGSGNIYQFISTANGSEFELDWAVASNASPFRVLSAGTATTPTDVSLSGVVPDVVYKRVKVGLVIIPDAAGYNFTWGLSATMPNGDYLSAEQYGRVVNGSNPGGSLLWPAVSVKLIARSLKYIIENSTGSNSLYIDARGFQAYR